MAWKAAIKAWSGGKEALMISLLAPGKAEVFFRSKDKEDILRLPKGATLSSHTLCDKDLPRRSRAYLQGYYKELRMATIQDLDNNSKHLLLMKARELLPTVFRQKDLQNRWSKTIDYDISQLPEFENV
jgi:hypothetical protein